jgi:hypothetical protein
MEEKIAKQLQAIKVGLTAAGVNPDLLERIGEKMTISENEEVEITAEYLASQVRESILTKSFTEGRHKDNPLYKTEVEELTRKRFNDHLKDLGEEFLPDEPEKAKEIAKKYKEEKNLSPALLRKYAAELKALNNSKYEEQLKTMSLEGKDFNNILNKERQERSALEASKMELQKEYERLVKEELPSIQENFKSQLAQERWRAKLFTEFYKVPSIYDEEISIGSATAEQSKQNHIENWLMKSFESNYETKSDGNGGLQFYEKGKIDPVWVTKPNGSREIAKLQDVIRMIAKDPVKAGRYFRASQGGTAGSVTPEDTAAVIEKAKKRSQHFGR